MVSLARRIARWMGSSTELCKFFTLDKCGERVETALGGSKWKFRLT